MSCVLDTVRKGSMWHPVSTMWHQRTLTDNSLGQSIEKCINQSIKLRREHPVKVLCNQSMIVTKGLLPVDRRWRDDYTCCLLCGSVMGGTLIKCEIWERLDHLHSYNKHLDLNMYSGVTAIYVSYRPIDLHAPLLRIFAIHNLRGLKCFLCMFFVFRLEGWPHSLKEYDFWPWIAELQQLTSWRIIEHSQPRHNQAL